MMKSVSKFGKKVLKNKIVLYLVIVLSILNVIAYISLYDYMSLFLFASVSLLGRYAISKNHIVYLLIALFATSFYNSRRAVEYFTEANTNHDDSTGNDDHSTDNDNSNNNEGECEPDDEECLKKKNQSGFVNRRLSPKVIDGNDDDESVGRRIDYASTLEKAYDNLQEMVGKKGVNSLMKDTQKLVAQQKSLMNVISNITPTLEKANDTLKGFNLDSTFGQLKHNVGKD